MHTLSGTWISAKFQLQVSNGYLLLLFFIITKIDETGKEDLWFNFQKSKYLYDAEEKKRFEPVAFPVDLPLKDYQNWKGFQEDEDVTRAKRRCGDNQ